jgi:hypothetical protein
MAADLTRQVTGLPGPVAAARLRSDLIERLWTAAELEAEALQAALDQIEDRFPVVRSAPVGGQLLADWMAARGGGPRLPRGAVVRRAGPDPDARRGRLRWPDGLDPLCPVARGYVDQIELRTRTPGHHLPAFVAGHGARCEDCTLHARRQRRRARRLAILTRLGLTALALTVGPLVV